MSIIVPRDRYTVIINHEDRPLTLKEKFELSCLGQIIMRIFCCRSSRVRPQWEEHRIYLMNNAPAYDHPDYELWSRAVHQVNRYSPWRQRIAYHRPAAVARSFFQRQEIYPSPVFLDTPTQYSPRPRYVPSPNPFTNDRPTSVVPVASDFWSDHSATYTPTAHTSRLTRPTSVVQPNLGNTNRFGGNVTPKGVSRPTSVVQPNLGNPHRFGGNVTPNGVTRPPSVFPAQPNLGSANRFGGNVTPNGASRPTSVVPLQPNLGATNRFGGNFKRS